MTAEIVCKKKKNIMKKIFQVLLKYIHKIEDVKRRLVLELHWVLITTDPLFSPAPFGTVAKSDDTERYIRMNWRFQ